MFFHKAWLAPDLIHAEVTEDSRDILRFIPIGANPITKNRIGPANNPILVDHSNGNWQILQGKIRGLGHSMSHGVKGLNSQPTAVVYGLIVATINGKGNDSRHNAYKPI